MQISSLASWAIQRLLIVLMASHRAKASHLAVLWSLHVTNRYAANSSNGAFASFRSHVSNPSVNHPQTGANRSRTLPWSRQRRVIAVGSAPGFCLLPARPFQRGPLL